MQNSNNNIVKLEERFHAIISMLRGYVSYGQQIYAFLFFCFISRVDSLTGSHAGECEAFYEKNKERLSDERLDKGLREIVGNLPFYNISGYNIQGILESQTSIEITFRTYVNGFCKILQELFLNSSMSDVIKEISSDTYRLKDMLYIVYDTEILMRSLTNEQFVSFVYEILEKSFESSRYFPEMFSPKLLCELMANCLSSEEIEDTPSSFCDPFCGMGRLFLTCSYQLSNDVYVPLYCNDINYEQVLITKAMIMFSGYKNFVVEHGDFLSHTSVKKKFKYIATEFPLNSKINSSSLYWSSSQYHPSNDATFLFIDRIVSLMDDRGSRAAFITSGSNLISSQDDDKRLALIKRDLVEAIISLPGRDFLGYSSMPVYLWILSNKKSSARKGKIQLVDGIHLLRNNINDKVARLVSTYRQFEETDYSEIVENEDFVSYSVAVQKGTNRQNFIVHSDEELKDKIDNLKRVGRGEYVKVDNSSVRLLCRINFNNYFSYVDDEFDIEDEIDNFNTLEKEMSTLKGQLSSVNNHLTQIAKKDHSAAHLPFGAFAEIVAGRSARPAINDEQLPFLTLSYLRNEEKTLVEVDENSRICTPEDSLIINKGGKAGEVFEGVAGVVSPWLFRIRPNNEIVLPRYLYYLLKGEEGTLKNMAIGAAIKNLSIQSLRSVQFDIPSLSKQKAIVEFLDERIKSIDRIIKMLGSTDTSLSHLRQSLISSTIKGKINLE